MIGVARYPDTLPTHGWRWYRVRKGKLVSPLSPYPVELDNDGVLENVYFVPGIEEVRSMAAMIKGRQWYPLAITFGAVSGALEIDRDMPRIGSMRCARYVAEKIYTDVPVVGYEGIPLLKGVP